MQPQYIEYYSINKSHLDSNLILDLQKIILGGNVIGVISTSEITYVAILDKALISILINLGFTPIEKPDYEYIYKNHTYFSPSNEFDLSIFFPELDKNRVSKRI